MARRPIEGLRRSADLVFARPKVAVFIDGCFWHGCPEHFTMPKSHVDYWSAKISRNQFRDREIDLALASVGWAVIRIWEHEDARESAVRIFDMVTTRMSRLSRKNGGLGS